MRLNKNPLRKIVGYIEVKISEDNPYRMQMEVYECGHYAPPKHDIIGKTEVKKRRCHKCGKNDLPQLSEVEIKDITERFKL